MKVKIGNQIYDSEKEPVLLIFDSDEQKDEVVDHLSRMVPQEGERMYGQFPEGTSEGDARKFMGLSPLDAMSEIETVSPEY